MSRVAMMFAAICVFHAAEIPADEGPAAINPFGTQSQSREDAVPGVVTLSDGTICAGKLYVTRDLRLRIYDELTQRQREIPFRSIQSIECTVKKEWMEKEWRFKENANDEKVYTGREYPVREYVHTVTLTGGRQITGPLSGIVYVEPYEGAEPKKFLMHKRQKGSVESSLPSLVYLQRSN